FELDKECDRRSASLMMASSDGRAHREIHHLERFTDIGVDGIIFISAGAGQGTPLSIIAGEKAPPVVALDRAVEGYDSVFADPRNGTVAAVDHVVTIGHTRIGYVTGLAGTQTAAKRLDVFYEAL